MVIHRPNIVGKTGNICLFKFPDACKFPEVILGYNMLMLPILTQLFLKLQEAVQVDGDVLFGLLKKSSSAVYKHMVSILFLAPLT